MTDTEIIEVVSAHAAGKNIQWKTMNEVPDLSWMDGAPMPWDFIRYRYRVAPEPRKPREWTLVECEGELYSKFSGLFPKYVRVREIIEEKNHSL